MNHPTPSIETVAGLYRAAHQNVVVANRGMDRITRSIERHGYTIAEVKKAAGIVADLPTNHNLSYEETRKT